jgi:hypothetical protein
VTMMQVLALVSAVLMVMWVLVLGIGLWSSSTVAIHHQ